MSKKTIKSDLARLDAMTDADIDYSDSPPLDDKFFEKLVIPWPPSKKQLTVRLDEDVLEWIKVQGKGYQNRINYILRAAMDSKKQHSHDSHCP
ncbi:MAG: BrnA antitoxin family protein [Methylococcaceae bacterium]